MNDIRHAHCLVGIAVAVALVVALGASWSALLVVGATLVCPLVMFVMMRSMTGGERTGERHPDEHAPVRDRR